MTRAREREALETALVSLRDPLSRIALATSELDTTSRSGGPATRSIQQAVGEIDLRIEDTLTSLRRRADAPDVASAADMRRSLAKVVDDLEPALGARGIDLALGPLPDETIPCDDSVVRRAACRVLLGVSRWMHTRPGRVEIGTIRDESETGVEVHAQLSGQPSRGSVRDILGPMRGFALAEDCSLEADVDADAGHARVVVWFDRRLAS